MAYSTQADLEQRAGGRGALIELADSGNGEVDTTAIDAAIRDADAWIDSYAQERYATPFAVPPSIIKRLSAEEAVYRLRMDRRSADTFDHDRHEQATEWLTQLAKGAVSVGVQPGLTESEQVEPECITRDEMDTDDSETVSRPAFRGFV